MQESGAARKPEPPTPTLLEQLAPKARGTAAPLSRKTREKLSPVNRLPLGPVPGPQNFTATRAPG